MRFYAVRTEAIELTHQALRQLDQRRQGSRRPSRALRVATLYGHLQCRARDGVVQKLGCRQLASAWHLHPRELRADLQDLAAIGWLTYSASSAGLCIRLKEPLLGVDGDRDAAPAEAPVPATPAAAPAAEESHGTGQPAAPAPSADTPEPASPSTPDQALMARFAEVYNQHRPQAWPAYSPRGTALAPRLRRAIRHAGGAEAFWPLLARALRSMPEFWRVTYPQGRTGADCAAALLSADRKAAGLGVEFWHVVAWGAYTPLSNSSIGGNTPAAGDNAAAAMHHPDYRRACRLLSWDGHSWLGVGMKAFDLPAPEKQRLAELLEAAGFGIPGQAARQFAATSRDDRPDGPAY